MADDSRTSLEEAFHGRLLAAVMEVKQHTRVGVQETLERIQSVGGLETARKRLSRLSVISNYELEIRLFVAPDDYFRAAKRVGRMDLSIEAIVLEPTWAGLFTPEELGKAASTLSEQGFNPPLERMLVSETPETALVRVHSPFAQMSLEESRALSAMDLCFLGVEECDFTAEQSVALHEGRRPAVSSVVRNHLNRCLECRKLYPDLVAAYEHFDQEVLGVWMNLLEIFQASLKLGDADLRRFMLTRPEDYEDPEDYETALCNELGDSIRPTCAWRAVRLGCHVGRFMSAFARTFAEAGDLWLKWRNREVQGPVSDFVRSVDRDLFILGLAACNLLLVRYWAKNEDNILWLPADGDLTSVPGLVQVDELTDLDNWEEVLGKAPEDLNLLAALYLAQQTAIAQVQAFENGGTDVRVGWAVQGQLDRIEALARAHQTSLDDVRASQDAAITQLERMVAYMPSTDRHASEQSLLIELHGVYEKLEPQARCWLLAAEQVYRTRDIAAPALLVLALAAAFEIQMQRSVVSPLLAYLKSKNTPKLCPPRDWEDTDHKKAVYAPNSRAEKFALGEMERLLRHPESAIDECFDLLRLNRIDVCRALAEVIGPRNDAAHGRPIDPGTAGAIRDKWLRWGGRPGGIFAVLFRGE